MILKRLSIRNFRQFREAEIELSPGLTAIIGANGSGKTTVIEAITWALYGEQRNTKETLRRYWAEGRAPTSVSVTFALGRESWRVERTLTSASLFAVEDQDRLVASSLREVTKAVEKLLGLSYEQFRNSFCTEQRDLSFLKFRTPNRQQEELGRMLGFDRIRTAAKTSKDRSKHLRDTAAGMAAAIGTDEVVSERVEQFRSAENEARLRLQQAQAALEASSEASAGAQAQRDRASAARTLIAEMRVRRQLGQTLKEQMDAASVQLNKAKSEALERDTLCDGAKEYEAADAQHKRFIAQSKQAESRLRAEATIAAAMGRADTIRKEFDADASLRVESAVSNMDGDAKELAGAEEALRLATDEWHSHRQAAQESLAESNARLTEISSRAEELGASIASGVCPICSQPWPSEKIDAVEEVRRRVADAERDLVKKQQAFHAVKETSKAVTDLTERVAQLRQRLEESRQTRDLAKAAMSEQTKREAELRSLEQQVKEQKDAMQDLPDKPDPEAVIECERKLELHHAAWIRFGQLADAVARLEAAELILKNSQEKFAEEKESQAAADAKLRELGFSPNEADRADAEVEEASKRLESLREAEASLKHAMEIAEERGRNLTAAETALSEFREKKLKIEEIERESKLYNEVGTALAELREALTERARPLLEQIASTNLAALSGGRYLTLKLSDRFEPTVIDENVEKDVISGGEEDIVALSLRLALAQLIQERSGQPMSLLMMDEVFGSLDAERRTNVLSQLEAMRDMFDQILVISHIEAINDAADRCLIVRYDPLTRESAVVEAVADVAEMVS